MLYQRVPRLFTDLALHAATAAAPGSCVRSAASICSSSTTGASSRSTPRLVTTLLETLEGRYGRRSTIVTSQHALIGDRTYDAAVLDRLVHSAHRIDFNGESLRRTRKLSRKARASGAVDMPMRLDIARGLPACPHQKQQTKTFKPRFKIDHAASSMPENRQPERLAPRATSNRKAGRDHIGTFGRDHRNPHAGLCPPPEAARFGAAITTVHRNSFLVAKTLRKAAVAGYVWPDGLDNTFDGRGYSSYSSTMLTARPVRSSLPVASARPLSKPRQD